MKALVLTYDARMPLAELTIQSYMKFWPNSGLEFRVPYNGDVPKTHFEYRDNVEFIHCDKFVKPTVAALLNGIPDNEWIYWCFDDCYIHDILEQNALNAIMNFLKSDADTSGIDSVRLLRFHDEKTERGQINFGNIKFDKKLWNPYRFWFHQFVRAGIMRTAFLDNNLPNNAKIAHVEAKRPVNPKGRHDVYIPSRDICVLGETSRGGMLTQNCIKALDEYGIPHEGFVHIPGFILNGADVNDSGMSSSVKNKNYLKRYL